MKIEWTEPEKVEALATWSGPPPLFTTRAGRLPTVLADADSPWHEWVSKIVGRINRKPVTFSNHIAMPETLLLTEFEVKWLFTATGERQAAIKISLLANLTRGVCEDGVTRHTGWNRQYRRDTGRWDRIVRIGANATMQVELYRHADDETMSLRGVEHRGFDVLFALKETNHGGS